MAWSTNLGAQVFAVDNQNLYASAGGSVLLLNDSGAVVQTNQICPIPGRAKRDSAGNYYFGGSFDGTQDFGGITLVGGWINNINFNPPKHAPGYPTCFVAKYASNGALVWATNFGVVAQPNQFTDLELDPAGGVYTGYGTIQNGLYVTHLSSSGGLDWTWNQPGSMFNGRAIKLGGATSSNCFALSMTTANQLRTYRLDRSNNVALYGQFFLVQRTETYLYSEPVTDDLARVYELGWCIAQNPCDAQLLRLCGPATNIWQREVTPNAEGILARDPAGNLYLGGPNGMLAQYSGSGDLIWSNNFSSPCAAMVIDGAGKRYLTLANGIVARLQDDLTPQPPSIASGPAAQTVFAGDNVSLTVSALGTAPLAYQWRFHATNLPGANGSQLSFNPVAASNAGPYSVVVSNSVGSVTSAPALLRVKSVQLYAGAQMLTNGNYVFGSPPTLTIRSAFVGGSNYYTLDGSAPNQSSTLYTGPFQLAHDAIVRAIGYSANQSQSEEADVVNATVYSQHTLSVTISGGGSVSLNPPGGTYWNTNSVTATAVPAIGWSFLFWLDDASGSSPSVTLSMQVDRSIIAVFGTNSPTGDPPGLAWSTNVGAQAFAVDEQTNVYAYAGGSVLRLNGDGAVMQTNQICPIPGRAKRDSAGNYYFGGSFDGTQDFGGITLVGGWINGINFNPPRHSPGYPTCFVAKYGSNGALAWATNFGVVAQPNQFTDLELDPAGGVYAGYGTIQNGLYVTHLSSTGGLDWTWNQPGTMFNGRAIKLGAATSSNCFALSMTTANQLRTYRLDRSGNVALYGQFFLVQRTETYLYSEPVTDDLARPYELGWCVAYPSSCDAQLLRLVGPGANIWQREVTPAAEGILARDPAGNLYLGGPNGMLAQYSGSGDLVWSNNFASPGVAMVVDPGGNRFVSFADGRVGRLATHGTSGSEFSIFDAGAAAGLSLVSAPQQVWRIEASSNLTSWSVLGTVTNSGGRLDFKDPSVATARTRFYRAVPVP